MILTRLELIHTIWNVGQGDRDQRQIAFNTTKRIILKVEFNIIEMYIYTLRTHPSSILLLCILSTETTHIELDIPSEEETNFHNKSL